jgi:hypothetical protein
MNEATLERLMMDAALGALSPDVEELLAAHVASDPGKVREAEELKQLVGRAREAITVDCPAEPDLRPYWMNERRRVRQMLIGGARLAAMAACVIVGMLIPKPRVERPAPAAVKNTAMPTTVVAVSDAKRQRDGELWSAQRIYQNAVEANRNERPAKTVIRSFQ